MAPLLTAIQRDPIPREVSIDMIVSKRLRVVKQYGDLCLKIVGDYAILTLREAIAECNSEAT